MRLEVAKQIKAAARDLSLDSRVKLIEDYSSPGTGGKPKAAISVFNFAHFVQAVAKAAIEVSRSDDTLYFDECEAFVEGLDDMRQETVGLDIVVY